MLTVFGLGLIRVNGRSMAPTLAPDDYVILLRYGRRRRPRAQDIVVYDHGPGRLRIKRLVAQRPDGRFRVRGDGVMSASSEDLGAVAPSMIRGRVVHAIRSRRPKRQP